MDCYVESLGKLESVDVRLHVNRDVRRRRGGAPSTYNI
jgi:hypothetical protein